jgi:hypothetical protein
MVFEYGVVIFRLVVETHSIRETSTPTLLDEQTKTGDIGIQSLAFEKLYRFVRSGLCYGDSRALWRLLGCAHTAS